MTARALILSGHDIPQWRQRYLDGLAPAPLPYLVDSLARADFELDFPGGFTKSAGAQARRWLARKAGFPLEATLRGARFARHVDVVIALLENEAIFPSLLRNAHLPPYSNVPLVIWSCWLGDQLTRVDAETRRTLQRRFAKADLITLLSRHEVEIYLEAGFSAEQLFPITYGVSHTFYTPDDSVRDISVLAVGQDRGRDYRTLFDAVSGTDLVLDVVCKPENLTGISIPDNVRIHGTVSHVEYRSLLRRAQILAVPTIEMAYPTGSSVALEASAAGCCVVASRTRAMADYIAHGTAGVLVPVGDSEAWRETLLELASDTTKREQLGAGARASIESKFNAHHMWAELANELRVRGIVKD